MNEARPTGVLLAVACLVLSGCIGRMGSSASSSLAEASVMPSSPAPSPIATSQATPTPDPSDPFNIAAMPGTAGPGCGTGQKGYFTHRDEIQHTLTLDGAPIELTTAAVGLRNGTYDADDAIPGYLGLSSDELAVKEVPAGKLVLAAKGMDLTKLTVGAVSWSTVDFSLDLPYTTATPDPVAWKLLTNGTIAITAPSKAGDYLLDMTVLWETECLHGDGTVYGRVLVR